MTPAPKAYEDDEELEATNEALSGSVTPAGGEDLSSSILGLLGELVKLSVALQEATEEEWSTCAARLQHLREIVSNFPTAPRPSRKVGFRVEPKKKWKTKRKAKK